MSHRRPIAALALAALLVLAGCGGFGGSGTTAATTTDSGTGTGSPGGGTTTADTATPTPDPAERFSSADLAAGINASTVTDSEDLLASHRSSLGDGHVGVMHINVSTPSATQNTTLTQRVGADGTKLLRFLIQSSGVTSETSLYSNGSTTFVRQKTTRGTTYSAVESGVYFKSNNLSAQLSQYLTLGAYNRTNVTEDGDTLVATYTADGVGTLPDDSPVNASKVVSFDSTLVVTESGQIRSLDLHYVVETPSGNLTYDISYDLERTSLETVAAPSWVSTAREQATMVDLSYEVVSDGVVKVTHEGGDTVPAGSFLQVVIRNTPDSYRGLGLYRARLTEDLEPGESIYLYRNSSTDIQGVISFDGPPAGDVAPFPSEGTVRVTIISPNSEIVAVEEIDLSDEDDDDR